MRPYVSFLIGAFLAALVAFQITSMGFAEDPVPQLIDAIGLVALIASPLLFFFGRSNPYSRRFFGLYAGYLLCLAISTALAGNPHTPRLLALGLDLMLDSKVYAIALLMFALLPPVALERCFRQVLWILLFVGLINLPFILRDLVSTASVHGVPLPSRSGFHVPVGLFDLKVKSAEFQVLSTIAAFALSLDPKWRRYPVWKPLIAIMAFSVVVHLSVKELTALGVVLIIYTTMRKQQHLGLTAILGLILMALFLFLSTVDTPIKSAFLDRIDLFLGESRGQTVRTAAYLGSFQLSSEFFPFGSGASTFMSKGARDLAYSPFYVTTGIAYLWGGSPKNPLFIMDTFWPKILGQAGWTGFLAYAAATLSMLAWSLRLFRKETTSTTFAATAIITSMLIFSFATPAYTHDHVIMPAAMSFAFVLSSWRPRRRPSSARPAPHRLAASSRQSPLPRENGRTARV